MFAAYLKRCPAEAYIKTGGIYHELAGVERRIDGYIELLKKGEFKEIDCVADLTKSVLHQYSLLASRLLFAC